MVLSEAPSEVREAGDASERSEADQVSPSPNAQTPSPFIEGTLIRWAWDATCLSDFKKCPRYYQLKRLEGWTNETGIHLRWGGELHKALEDYDRERAAGIKHDDAIHDVLRVLLERIEDWEPEPRTKSEELKTKANLVRAVVWYLDHYNPDPAETYILANGKPAVELNFNFALDFGPGDYWRIDQYRNGELIESTERQSYHLCGYLDRVVNFHDDLYIMDRKSTTTTLGSYYFDRYDNDNQMSLYTLAGQILLQSPIKGVIIDAIQVAVGFIRPVRGFTYRTPDGLDEWLVQTRYWIAQAEQCAVHNYWPMNDTSCDKYGGCEFRGICSKSPVVRQKFLESEFRKEELWNPLLPR